MVVPSRSALALMLFGVVGAAQAEDVALVPKQGMTYTVKFSNTMHFGERTQRSEATIERHVVQSDGQTAKVMNVVTLSDCKANGSQPCGPSTFINGPELYTILRFFIPQENSVAFSHPGPDGADVRTTNTSRIECDPAILASFLPIGHLQQIVVPCTITPSSDKAGQIAPVMISFEGRTRIETPAGEFPVSLIRMRYELDGGKMETLYFFSERHGIAIRAELAMEGPNLTLATITELLSIAP